jgi:hypothetical protein
VTAILGSIRRDAAGLAAAPDPLEAELFVSGVLAMWHPDMPDDAEPLDILGKTIIQRLAGRADPDVFALLLAIEALATSPFDAAARLAVEQLRKLGIPEPIWSRSIGRPTLVDAWVSWDELDDQAHVLAAFAHDHRPPHAVNLIIDANFQGLIRGAFVADNPDKVRREWVAASGLPIRPLSEQALADILGQGIEMFDAYLEPPVSDEAKDLMPLVRARLRLLPTPRPVERRETPDQEREALIAAFGISPEASGLAQAGRGPAADLARWFIDFACDYGAGDPLRWSPIAVETLLADWLPRKAILEPAEIEALPDVLRRFVRFSARRKGLADDLVAETLDAVDHFARDFVEGMADDDRSGPAKQILAGLRASGVDLTDEAAVQRWIDKRNAGLRLD